ncbi:hypothetical protein AVEN_274180-1 [Araneus ventricosus]|uniref:Uncharacterized protein n=1 Tax=Araneus ventricosus TaxID=182803 RepID=A0A4Y2WR13_ARAVE|nr:hypothetical protein AVEN_215443-1 [Araneus ventricosus]GBO38387.1 hypothetical protein AVEN_274180-1 [Araneus ventricosus]
MRGALYEMPSLFMFRATKPPEIGAMAKKITLLHRLPYEKATPSTGLTSLGLKIRNRHVESCVYKNVLEPVANPGGFQSSCYTNSYISEYTVDILHNHTPWCPSLEHNCCAPSSLHFFWRWGRNSYVEVGGMTGSKL